MARLSLVVITRNEEHDLPRCLASVPCADEIVVVDSGSTDRTLELAEKAGARVISHPWEGYGPQKAFALAQAQGEWVLNLDADEALTPELAAQLPAAIARAGVDGFKLQFQSEIFGRTMRHGGLGHESHLRLYRRARTRMKEQKIHEGVAVDGPVETLPGYVLHRPYADLAEFLAKLDSYTTLAAEQRFAEGRKPWLLWPARLPVGFLRRYALQLGFLDGRAGFLWAALGGMHDLVREAKLQELADKAARLPPATKT